ncbi:iron(III) transport system substrate-binding protein [Stella humosa]|uniref:Iron(III) transport system substrate-binding protein n=1 Tax=Stella humosa TaxID=94 RepID=A0A3N1MCM9_9PROT|nr:extracellular solute-binding protein [Stella humosa]ROQ01358.1 iron(III) transport system substrate-binding protein [Stella humosa]BBK31732.1 ABC transporter substrate-binding protein [Stella humosa]
MAKLSGIGHATLPALAALLLGSTAALAQECCPKELVDAANKEGKLVLYTALLLDSEQIVMKEFNKKFPRVKVDIVRAPGARLFTRIETEAAAGKLGADVIDMTDRGLAKRMEGVFADYAPPNADQWNKETMISPKLWSRTTHVYGLAYNTALVKDPPKSWQDMTKPAYKGRMGLVIAGSGGTTWTTAMYQRKVLGEGYWKAVADVEPRLYESNGPLATAVVSGEVQVAMLLVNGSLPLKLDGAPIEVVYPTEGMPTTPGAAGITKTAVNPNAAKLFLNWFLSLEGQNAMVGKLGFVSLLKGADVPPGAPKDIKLWIPDKDEYEKIRDKWIDEWNVVYKYRQ